MRRAFPRAEQAGERRDGFEQKRVDAGLPVGGVAGAELGDRAAVLGLSGELAYLYRRRLYRGCRPVTRMSWQFRLAANSRQTARAADAQRQQHRGNGPRSHR